MKIVIDIDKNRYEDIKRIASVQTNHRTPTVEQIVSNGTPLQKGHWISHKTHCKKLGVLPSGLGSYWWCSKCDTGIDSIQFSRVEHNFCPKCGAKMVEPQESEDKE